MTITLRARPRCHYCGKRNKPVGIANRFKCAHCLAENFLDDDGEVADVPHYLTATSESPANRFERPFDATDSIFCSTCLKNQHIYTQKLSDFLPDPDDLRYEELEAAIPAFKARLEQDYPQCCAQCEPKVRAKLQEATYYARSDHLRRVLDKSRMRRITSAWGWRRVVVNITGLVYLFSLLVQLTWHGMASQADPSMSDSVHTLAHCFAIWPVPVTCSGHAERFVGASLSAGTVCLWWNPKWQHKLAGREGSLRGLAQYYRTQVVLMTIRFLSWVIIRDVPALQPFRPMLHSLSLVLIMTLATYSVFAIISIDTTPLVDWQQDPATLLSDGQYVPPTQPLPSVAQTSLDHFSSPAKQAYTPWQPPTPPEADEDAMDWTPASNIGIKPRRIVHHKVEPSPFYGTLPSLQHRGIYGSNKHNQIEPRQPVGIPTGFFDKPQFQARPRTSSSQDVFAQPKFFAADAPADTGLENIFDTVFSLHDHVTEARRSTGEEGKGSHAAGARQQAERPARTRQTLAMIYSTLASIVYAALLVFFLTTSYIQLTDELYMSWALYALTVVPGFGLGLHGLAFRSSDDAQRFARLCFETSALALLSLSQPSGTSLLKPLWSKLAIGASSLLLVQELCCLCGVETSTATPRQEPLMQPPAGLTRNHSEFHATTTNAAPLSSAATSTPRASITPADQPQLARRASSESLTSQSSINTTSTASGWKTPVMHHRGVETQPRHSRRTGSSGTGVGTLSFDTLSFGTSVAGLRDRRPPNR